jgi:hypothetical protein
MRKSLNPNIPVKIIPFVALLAFSFCAALPDTSLAQPLTITTIAGQYGNQYFQDGVGTNATFDSIGPMAADQAGNLYVIEVASIQKISPDHTVTTFAGNPAQAGHLDATGTDARFGSIQDIAVDKNGYLYVTDYMIGINGYPLYYIRKISPSAVVTTLTVDVNSSGFRPGYTSIAVDSSGNIYLSGGGAVTYSSAIGKITPDGVVSILAEEEYVAGFDGFNGMTVDGAGIVYVAIGSGIQKISPDGTVTTWVGSPIDTGGTELDGIGTNAAFYGANGIALDRAGGAYVTDYRGKTIRYVSPAGGVTTVAGLANTSPTTSNDGVGSDARFRDPEGIAMDTAGNVYITDAYGDTVLKGVPPSLPPIGSFSESPGGTPVRFNNPWQFTAYFTNIVSDLRLRVQSTTTTNDEGSWTDLPGNLSMTDVDGNWNLNTTNVPTGTQYFRVVASAPGYLDSASAAVGPEIVLGPPPLPPIGSFSESPGGTPVRSSNPWQFTASYSTLVSDLRLHVQSTTTTNIQGSWTDLPYGGQMADQDGNWTLNTTDVPTGIRYFRVDASAPGYADSASAAVGPETVLDGIAPFGFFSWNTTGPQRNGALWTFTITEPSIISDLRLVVQSSPDNLSSWSDLPDGGQMGHIDATWTLNTTNLPLGQQFFRVVASAPTYFDRNSASVGPFNIEAALIPFTITTSGAGYHVLDLNAPPEMQDPAKMVYLTAVANAIVQYIITGNLEQELAAVTLAADQFASVELKVGTGQTLTLPALNAGPGASVELKGTINGEVTLISQDGGSFISQDGGSLTYDAVPAGIVASGAGNIVASGAGNIVASGAGNIVASGAGNIVSTGGSKVVGVNGPAVFNRNINGFTPSNVHSSQNRSFRCPRSRRSRG